MKGRASFTDRVAAGVKTGDDERGAQVRALPSSPPARVPRDSRPGDRQPARDGLHRGPGPARQFPKTLLVVGGGYIGLELGTVYAALGSKVTVVEMTPGLLPGRRSRPGRPLAKRLGKSSKGSTRTQGRRLVEAKSGIEVTLEGKARRTTEQRFDRVLVAVGRRPTPTTCGLEKTQRARSTSKGFIVVDEQRRTAEPTIFAIGDVAGEPMLAHKASHEARVAVEAIAGEQAASSRRRFRPWCSPTRRSPGAGLTEAEAQDRRAAIEVPRFPWAGVRARSARPHRGRHQDDRGPETDASSVSALSARARAS